MVEETLTSCLLTLQLHYYVHFQTNTFEKDMNPFIPLAMG